MPEATESTTPTITFASVWDAIADTHDDAENLKVRSRLMSAISAKIDEFGWSQTKAAHNMGVTQPRISDLVNGKIDKFSVDSLINLGAAVGVHLSVTEADGKDDLVDCGHG
jgi:predicted XRE-type DNA-binding protein